MAVNLKYIQKEMTKYLHKQLGLDDFKIEIEKNENVTARNNITIKGFDDDVYVSFIVFKSGSFGVDFVFDKLEVNQTTLSLIQDFNKTSVWLSGFIRDDGYFVLRYNVAALSEDDVMTNVKFILDQIISDKIKQVLAPILSLTN